ncbi:potassium channel family protein [Mucilaginibacter sp. OK098]|uniref:potassium channel family protein n=1 Tax=Mucilaginibacter sp. OK098 TaxID=1855297 RepID=UPI0009166468|nr:potassium channel family protein [Mucilaginibacter sp. OK098]SHM89862.1 Ion channel [Mucilaginibacter sp. OK098]
MSETRESKPFFETNWNYLLTICQNKHKPAFGLQWLVRFLLQVTAFFCLDSMVKTATDGLSVWVRRVAIECYAVSKLVLIYYSIQKGFTTDGAVVWILIYLSVDTLHALLSGIFLRYLWSDPLSYKRNFILAFLNYMEIVLCFAAIYNYYDYAKPLCKESVFIVSDGLKPENLKIKDFHLGPNQVIYFSFVTAATIGYGDISPRDEFVQKIVITEIMVTLALVVIIFGNIVGKLDRGVLDE